MGFVDKLKATAQDVAGQGRDKLEDVQTKRKMDAAAQQLGYLVHRERTEAIPAGSQVEELMSQITALKQQLEDRSATAGAGTGPGGTAGSESSAVPNETPPASTQGEPGDPDRTPPPED